MIVAVWLGAFYCAVLTGGACAQPPVVNKSDIANLLSDARSIKEEIKILTQKQWNAVEENAKVKFHPAFDGEYHFFIGEKDGRVAGYVVMDTVYGRRGPIQYMLSLDPDGKIKEVVLLDHSERLGKPSAMRRFLRQFAGKTARDKLRLKKDIHAVTGATVSSRSISNGIRKAIHVFNEIYMDNRRDHSDAAKKRGRVSILHY
ncbi:MAG: FMN-binding protein [Candidatus Omnitrophota bacterium]